MSYELNGQCKRPECQAAGRCPTCLALDAMNARVKCGTCVHGGVFKTAGNGTPCHGCWESGFSNYMPDEEMAEQHCGTSDADRMRKGKKA